MELKRKRLNRDEPYPVGTRVKIGYSGFENAEVVEDRGFLGPGGARVYRVMVVRKPRMYIEVLEEQLEAIENTSGLPPAGM